MTQILRPLNRTRRLYPFDGNSSDISGNNLNGTNTSVQWEDHWQEEVDKAFLPGTDNKSRSFAQ